MNNEKYLKVFFEEKDLPYESWTIQAKDGMEHIIDSDYVKEVILSLPEDTELMRIADTIRKIDFKNGNVNHYLKFLAECLVNNY